MKDYENGYTTLVSIPRGKRFSASLKIPENKVKTRAVARGGCSLVKKDPKVGRF